MSAFSYALAMLNDSVRLVGTHHGLAHSTDAGITWLAQPLEEVGSILYLLPLEDSCVIAMGQRSVHLSSNRGESWHN